MSDKVVAVAGATGAVGTEMLRVLEARKFPVKELIPLASARSVGKKLTFAGEEIVVRELGDDSFEGVDVALFSAGAARSKKFAPAAVAAGAVVVDNSSAFRMDDDVPLVVPEVNPSTVLGHHGIIANPNCSTIQMVVVLYPLHREHGIIRVVVTTFQAVSGTGKNAVEELSRQIKQIQEGEPVTAEIYPHQIAYNALPHIDVFGEDGYTREETKMIEETRKIMGEPGMAITATTVRIPVFVGHSESVNIQFGNPVEPGAARALLEKAPGVEVFDDPQSDKYPMAIYCEGKDPSYVGRIRVDHSAPNALNLWIVSDNLRKGAALNAVQIAELLLD